MNPLSLAHLFVLGGSDTRPGPEHLAALAREDDRVLEHLDVLVDRIGPRLSGSSGLQGACAWARERFASFGLHGRPGLQAERGLRHAVERLVLE